MSSLTVNGSVAITTSLASARVTRLCGRMAAGLVDSTQAEALVGARLEDLERVDTIGIQEACQDAVSELLVRAVQREEPSRHRCAERLLALWSPDIIRWCRWLCHRSQPVEDLAQEVLLVLFTDLARVRRPDQLRRWLHSVAWRKVRAHRRLAWFRLRSRSTLDEQRLGSDGSGLPERLERVALAMDDLGMEQRRLLWLVYVEGWSRREVAELVGLAEGTLNRRLSRARAAFTEASARRGVVAGFDHLREVAP